jgi:hypothetical protein
MRLDAIRLDSIVVKVADALLAEAKMAQIKFPGGSSVPVIKCHEYRDPFFSKQSVQRFIDVVSSFNVSALVMSINDDGIPQPRDGMTVRIMIDAVATLIKGLIQIREYVVWHHGGAIGDQADLAPLNHVQEAVNASKVLEEKGRALSRPLLLHPDEITRNKYENSIAIDLPKKKRAKRRSFQTRTRHDATSLPSDTGCGWKREVWRFSDNPGCFAVSEVETKKKHSCRLPQDLFRQRIALPLQKKLHQWIELGISNSVILNRLADSTYLRRAGLEDYKSQVLNIDTVKLNTIRVRVNTEGLMDPQDEKDVYMWIHEHDRASKAGRKPALVRLLKSFGVEVDDDCCLYMDEEGLPISNIKKEDFVAFGMVSSINQLLNFLEFTTSTVRFHITSILLPFHFHFTSILLVTLILRS